MDKVGLQKNSCKIIDVTNKRGTVETLTEAKISCVIETNETNKNKNKNQKKKNHETKENKTAKQIKATIRNLIL